MDIGAQPVEQRDEIPLRKIGVEIAKVPTGGIKQLSRDKISQRVSGEVTKQTGTPMDIL